MDPPDVQEGKNNPKNEDDKDARDGSAATAAPANEKTALGVPVIVADESRLAGENKQKSEEPTQDESASGTTQAPENRQQPLADQIADHLNLLAISSTELPTSLAASSPGTTSQPLQSCSTQVATVPIDSSSIKCALINCQGVEYKWPSIKGKLISNNISVVGLTETWDGKYWDSLLREKDYHVYICNRERDPSKNKTHVRGGAAILIKKSPTFSSHEVANQSFNDGEAIGCQFVMCKVSLTPQKNILVCCVYRSDKCKNQNFSDCLQRITVLKRSADHVASEMVVLGDFNCREIEWSTFPQDRLLALKDGRKIAINSREKRTKNPSLRNFARSLNLTQFVTNYTRKSIAPRSKQPCYSILDLVFSTDRYLVLDCIVEDKSKWYVLLDHEVVLFSLSTSHISLPMHRI